MINGKCPKCESTQIIKYNLSAQPWRNRSLFQSIFSPLTHPMMYICENCGYLEEYINKKDINKLKKT